MEKHWVEKIFEECGAMLKGHFVLASWKHSGEYVDKTMLYTDGERISDICFEIASEAGSAFPTWNKRIDVVVGPAEGGIILAHEVAKRLSEIYQRKVYSIFTEKDKDGNQVLERPGFKKLVAGSLVLIVDDILASGGSIKKVIQEIQKSGGHVVAVAVIYIRGGVTSSAIFDYPLFSLLEKKIESFDEEDCPLCKEHILINTEVGRGKEYVDKKAP